MQADRQAIAKESRDRLMGVQSRARQGSRGNGKVGYNILR